MAEPTDCLSCGKAIPLEIDEESGDEISDMVIISQGVTGYSVNPTHFMHRYCFKKIARKESIFKELDHKLGQAIKQNKTPMIAYHYASLKVLFDLYGRTSTNKELCPNWRAWNLFTRMMREGHFQKLFLEAGITEEKIRLFNRLVPIRSDE